MPTAESRSTCTPKRECQRNAKRKAKLFSLSHERGRHWPKWTILDHEP